MNNVLSERRAPGGEVDHPTMPIRKPHHRHRAPRRVPVRTAWQERDGLRFWDEVVLLGCGALFGSFFGILAGLMWGGVWG